MQPMKADTAKPANIVFAIQKTSAPTAHSAMTPSPAITTKPCSTRPPIRLMSRSRMSERPTPSGSLIPAMSPQPMLTTIVATMPPPITHSMSGNQSTSVSGPPPAFWSTSTTYATITRGLTISPAQALRSSKTMTTPM